MTNTSEATIVATVDDRIMTMHWYRVAAELAPKGPRGVSHFRGRHNTGVYVNCLFWRDDAGHLRGVLFHYRADIAAQERRGNVNMWVDPGWHRRGIGGALLAEADRRWKLNLEQQSYTNAGLALVRAHLNRFTPAR